MHHDFVLTHQRQVSADTLTPIGLLLAARRHGLRGFLLESVEGGRHLARYSILGFEPQERILCRSGQVELERFGERESVRGSLPEVLKVRLVSETSPTDEPLPRFVSGFVGYVGSACAAETEHLQRKPDPLGLPDAILTRFGDLLIYDHVQGQVLLRVHATPERFEGCAQAMADARDRLDRLATLVKQAAVPPLDFVGLSPSSPELPGRAAFIERVRRAQDHIQAGDVFQIVLSLQALCPCSVDPTTVYRRLRMGNPSPYHFFLDFPEGTVLGASPETLLRIEGTRAEVHPIAGTRPRGRSNEADAQLVRELLEDPKETAEHVMLVDLGRNDLGRVCRLGSVRVEAFREVERYSHVLHVVSRVTGELDPEVHPVDAFFAAFPAGTVSGAPKRKALELIDALEGPGRGIYSGAVGYFDDRGNVDTCIAIRTVILRDGLAHIQAGAGVVALSDPDREFDECRHKLAPLAAAIAAEEVP